jgi:hyperosmotically inducible protein
MLQRGRVRRGWLSAVTAASVLFVGVLGAPARAQDAARVDADAHKALNNKKFSGVTVAVHDGNVLLGGTVTRYADKEEADNRIHHVTGVKGVDNEINVAGGEMSDAALRDQLAKKLSTYTVGYGTTAFTSLTIGVKDGIATVGGTVYWQPDRDAALSLVANTPGVRDIVDNIQVAPLSPMDDGIRLRVARTIYGTPALQKYAIDPAKPIRIVVINGNVTLEGVVDNKMDRDLAGIRANTVPGVFKVVNNLQVAGPQSGQ